MKKAIAYARISNEDQSNWSIEGQLQKFEDHSIKENTMLVKTFTDDGYSAKDFNRPAWKDLIRFIENNKVDEIWIVAWDRLSRNLLQALTIIDKLETKYKIQVVSILQNSGMDKHNPFSDKMRKDFIMYAEFERKMISWRTGFGTHQARSSGRFIGHAPMGYENARDDNNKPIIVPHPEQRTVVVKMFEMLLDGHSLTDIKKFAWQSGCKRDGNSWVKRLLTNPVLAGFVPVAEWGGHEKKLAKGIHEPIVDVDIFWQAQELLKSPERVRVCLDEELYLRGFIKCEHDHVFTGSNVRGKSGTLYPYYICKKCKKQNHIAKRVHEDLLALLKDVSLSDTDLAELKERIRNEVLIQIEADQQSEGVIKRKIREVEARIDSIEEKYINNNIEHATYRKWMAKLSNERAAYLQSIADNSSTMDIANRVTDRYLERMTDFAELFQNAAVANKQELLRVIFPRGLTRVKGGGKPHRCIHYLSETHVSVAT